MTKKHCGRTEQRRQESLNEYVDGIMQTNSRIDVIRVDLYYRQENRDDVTLESFDNDINRLYTNKRGNTLFKNSKGYIIKMEQGDSGYNHLHAHQRQPNVFATIGIIILQKAKGVLIIAI